MKRLRSIRWRIQLWYAAFLLAMVVVSGVAVFRLEQENLQRLERAALRDRMDDLFQLLDAPRNEQPGATEGEGEDQPPSPPPRPPAGGPPLGGLQKDDPRFAATQAHPYYFAIWRRDGGFLVSSPSAPKDVPRPEFPAGAPRTRQTDRTRDGYLEIFKATPPGEIILVGRSLGSVEASITRFGWMVVGLGTAIVAFGLAIGWWIADRALRPVRDIGQAAARISAGNLNERIRVTETDTELGALAAVLNDAFGRLEAAVQNQARFTSDAAHELRTPVSVVLAETQLILDDENTNPEARETATVCRRAAQRMHGLIESLLELAVVEGNPQSLEKDDWDLGELGANGVDIMRLLAQEKNIRLTASTTPAHCQCDAERIQQIILNLLSNSIKFSPKGADIEVSSGLENGQAFLRVKDTGPGISADHLPHLFDRFYRVDRSRSRGTGGTGLGLAICKGIAEAHGGTLTAESTAGQGSTFTLRLPVG